MFWHSRFTDEFIFCISGIVTPEALLIGEIAFSKDKTPVRTLSIQRVPTFRVHLFEASPVFLCPSHPGTTL